MLLGLYCIRVPSLFVQALLVRLRREALAAAAPPSIAMNSRRFTSSMAPPPFPPVGEAGMTISQGRNALKWLCTLNLPQSGAWGSSMWAKANTLRRDRHAVGAGERAR
jgi:hypothetical protein